MEKHIHCPANGWDCPYFKHNGTCALVDEGADPMDECDDFAAFWDREDDYWCDGGCQQAPFGPADRLPVISCAGTFGCRYFCVPALYHTKVLKSTIQPRASTTTRILQLLSAPARLPYLLSNNQLQLGAAPLSNIQRAGSCAYPARKHVKYSYKLRLRPSQIFEKYA